MSYNKQIINICRLAIIFSLTCIGSIIAQELATTKGGKLIVLFKDSTWKYMDMETWLNLKENNEKIIRENEQIMDSILSDIWKASIKYSSDNTEVDLIVVKKDNIEFQIKDSGIGISKADINKLTQPFFQANQTVSTKGFGLGLTICKKIIESHKGRLSIESEPEDGSVFTLYLPKI